MWRLELIAVFAALSMSTASSCGFPGSPAHAKVLTTDERFMEGTVVTFDCDPGYLLLGRSMLRCVNSEWDSPGLPFCVREIAFLKPSGLSTRNETAYLAVDDQATTCAVTNRGKNHEWWVDLIEANSVHIVEVHYGSEEANLTVSIIVGDTESNSTSECIHDVGLSSQVGSAQYFKCNQTAFGRELRIRVSAKRRFILTLCEVKVYSQSVLSPQDSCGSENKGKIESFKGKCFEVTPVEASFHDAQKFCAAQGGSLWTGDQSEFVSWMMNVHNLDSVWYRNPALEIAPNATNCTAFTRDDQLANGSEQNATCIEARFGICVRSPQSCGKPPVPKHLSSWNAVDKVPTGEIFKNFSCENGFHLSGPPIYQCLDNGQFQQQMPTTCRQSMCGEPPSVLNAFPVLVPHSRYYCVNDSFVLYGPPDLTCDPLKSQWATPHAVCVRLSSSTRFSVRSLRERLLQGVALFPVATKVGLVLFIITLIVLKILVVIAIVNLVRFYRVVKPKLNRKHNSSVMLSSIHNELSQHLPQATGATDRNHLTVDANQDLELSTGDAQVVIRTTGSSTPKAPRTPSMRLNESSIGESRANRTH